jgi:hypothetical protein
MKVIFLDIDGVICLSGGRFDDDCVEQLRRVIFETDASVCISSTWRLYSDSLAQVKELLNEVFADFVGCTPELIKNILTDRRSTEIQSWLNEQKALGVSWDRIAIIDDDITAKIPEQPESYFRTSINNGLTETVADKVIDWLNEK